MSSIQEYVDQIRIIDGHEHLSTPQIRKREDQDLFSLLHYLESDLVSAGMPRGLLSRRSQASDEEKAGTFLSYWQRTSNTTYARMFRTAMEDLHGLKDWSVGGLLTANESVKRASQDPGWYDKVMVERSGIDLAFTLIQTTELGYDRFRPIMFLDFAFKLRRAQDILDVEMALGLRTHDLRQYLEAVDSLLHRYVQEGMVATKLGHAYWRSLTCGKPTFSEAERVFNRLRSNSLDEGASQDECLPLQDYLIHFIVQRSTAYGLPIQIHTGHHETSVSGNGNRISNANVEGLIPLLLEYTDARFVLLHGGFPYSSAYLSIAKNFPNVYADFTWIYIISPTAAKHLLHQVIEMVPQSKIQGFGGDYNFIEGTYAHQKLARRVISEVLTEKIKEGALSEKKAMSFAEGILRDNLIDLYKLDNLKK